MTDKPVTQQRPVKKEKVNFFFAALEFNNPYGLDKHPVSHPSPFSGECHLCLYCWEKELTLKPLPTSYHVLPFSLLLIYPCTMYNAHILYSYTL